MGLEALLVFVLVLVPGMIGDSFLRFILWQGKPGEAAGLARTVIFSVVSLALLLLVRVRLNLDPVLPPYLDPGWWEAPGTVSPSDISDSATFWLQQALLSSLVGLAVGWILQQPWLSRLLEKVSGRSLFDGAWSQFAAEQVGNWVLVHLSDGRRFYGQLGVASAEFEDGFMLWNPAPYWAEGDEERIRITPAKGLFLPLSQVSSIQVSYSVEEMAGKDDTFGIYNPRTMEKIDGRRAIEASTDQPRLDSAESDD